MTTLVEVWTALRRRFEAAGIETPVIDARLLLEAGAGVSRLDIITDPRRAISAEQAAAVERLAQRREAREPVSQIIGRKGFWTFELSVTADVLTPRPDTELVVDTALEMLTGERPSKVLDLGVGSGAILLAILHERPLARGVAVDASAAALRVAQTNAKALGLDTRIDWIGGSWDSECGEGFDIVVSNPPYIPSEEIAGLEPEVARFEPRLALDGGEDGLDAYRMITPALPRLLRPGGGFVLEVGKGQAPAVAALAEAAGLSGVHARRDLAGVERVVAGRAAGSG